MDIYKEIIAKIPRIHEKMKMEAALRILLDRIIELEREVEELKGSSILPR